MPVLGKDIYVEDSLAERCSSLANVQFCQTPTLPVAGTKDHCIPSQYAQYFHAAPLDQGMESVLSEYPREELGVRLFPQIIVAYSRILGWFDTFIQSRIRELGLIETSFESAKQNVLHGSCAETSMGAAIGPFGRSSSLC